MDTTIPTGIPAAAADARGHAGPAGGCGPGPAGPLRLRQGEAEVVVLTDGFFPLPADIVAPDASPAEWAEIESRLGGSGGAIRACVNLPVIRHGEELTVVDLGGGGRFAPTEGRLFANVVAQGFDPQAVTRVLLTHAHPDHLWGLLDDAGGLRFPNATYYISAAEWDFWSRPEPEARMPAAIVPFATGARRNFAAIEERVVMLRPGDQLAGGLQAVGTPGHTPGHLSFLLPGPDPLLLAGDALTNQVVSVEHPAWRFGNDTEPALAADTRLRLLDQLAGSRARVLAVHFAYPGLGRIARQGSGYRFLPHDGG